MYIKLKNVSKSYGTEKYQNLVIDNIDLSIKKGEICTIVGPSGSGKSTVLNILGGIEKPDSGDVIINDVNIASKTDEELAKFRLSYFGYIFQFYNLISNLTLIENIKVCEFLSPNPLNLDTLVDALDLNEHVNKFPPQLSGGLQQRCAIARAIIKKPKILLCDEPTGAVDFKTSIDILKILEKINVEYGVTIIIVTHNLSIKKMSNRIIEIKDGKVINNVENNKVTKAEDLDW